MALLAVDRVRRFGTEPKVALLSHSNFGSSDTETSLKMRRAAAILRRDHPELEVEGEMHADSALDERIRSHAYPDSKLTGSSNLLIMPTLDAANIAFNLDPSRKSGGALHRLHCFCLEFDRAFEVQRRVPTDGIIEPIDVSGYGSFSLAS